MCEGSTSGVTSPGTYAAFMEVELHKEDGQWRAFDFTAKPFTEGIREKKK